MTQKGYKLVDSKTGKPIPIGSLRSTFRNEVVKVIDFDPVVRNPNSSGKVVVRRRGGDRDGFEDELIYPSVIDAKIVEVDDE